jgi:selT/selW/selH-like putative selenoprotein
LAGEIRKAFNIDVKLKSGLFGTFDIIVNGKPVFSKSQIGRFPDEGEIITIIKEMQAGSKV